MKIRSLSFIFSLLLLLSPCAAFAGFDDSSESSDELTAAIGMRGWFTQADAKWQISFPYITSGGQIGKIESELRFKNIDSPMFVMTGGGKIAPEFSFDVLLGMGSIAGGSCTDIDRFVSPGGSLEFSRSRSDISGDVRMWGGNVYFNNAPHLPSTRFGGWGAVFGFLHYEDNLTLRNGVQTNSASFDGMYMPLGPFSGLNSTYDFSWNMLKIGVLNRTQADKNLSFLSQFAVYPYVDYHGEGYWNLRAGTGPTDFRVQSPNFVHDSNKGYGLDASLEVIFTAAENVELSAGYRHFYLYAKDGTDRVY
ncbi:MAG TPA: hypothetical protein VIX18_04295, partial [Nitrospirota bacterium]